MPTSAFTMFSVNGSNGGNYSEAGPKIVSPSLDLSSSGQRGRQKSTLHRIRSSGGIRELVPFSPETPEEWNEKPEPLYRDAWDEPAAEEFKVRGRNYLNDRKKIYADASVFKLWTVDMVKVNEPFYSGLCNHPGERVQRALRIERETGTRALPDFIFAVNLVLPAPKGTYQCVSYFALDDARILRDQDTPLGRVAEPFFFGQSDEFRDETFKLIPRIVDGNFVVKKAVGNKPSIVGTKVKQHYIQNERFFELIVDVPSDPLAAKIVKLAIGCAKSVVVDMMFVLEGKQERMLPERILGGFRLKNVDFNK